RIGCQTGFSNPSTISSTIAATLGTHSSTNPGRLCPSRDATGQQSVTQSEDWYYADEIPASSSVSRTVVNAMEERFQAPTAMPQSTTLGTANISALGLREQCPIYANAAPLWRFGIRPSTFGDRRM